jgi:glycosyltransferase involved in cell wall biosynthesis
MKILMVNKFFYPKGGSELVFFQERDFLLKHGYKVMDFSMLHPWNGPSSYSDYFVDNVEYRSSQLENNGSGSIGDFGKVFNFIHNREAVKKLRLLIQKEKPDIAHLHNIYHQLTPAIIPVLKDAGVKVILTLHDYKLVCPNYLMLKGDDICNKCNGKKFWNAILYKCCDGKYLKSLLLSIEAHWHQFYKTYEMVDCIICPSHFLADLVSRTRGMGDKITVLPNGIDTSDYSVSGIDKNYVLYLGRLSKEKGIKLLLDAYHDLSCSKTSGFPDDFTLKIAGAGDQFDTLKNQYKGPQFYGHQTGPGLRRLISESSFIVVPSQCYENCSMAVLESMACGKPVIASNLGGLPEQIEHGKTGLLFEVNDLEKLKEGMVLLAGNPQLRRDMGLAARNRCEEEFSFEGHAKRLLELYHGLAD